MSLGLTRGQFLAVVPLRIHPLNHSPRSAHFIDPAFRVILDTSLTADDNDLFLTNLVDTPILAVHGWVFHFFPDLLHLYMYLTCILQRR